MNQLVDALKSANRTVVYTGAGMSTESGIPDFRSKSRGLWEKFNPEELANVRAIYENQEEFTSFYQTRLADITNHQPHQGHFILSEWEKSGLVDAIITQNVDGFHHDAGSENVMELHGTFRKFHCHSCGNSHERETYLAGDATCASCGDIVRPGIVLFGESLPQDTFLKAEEVSLAADLFIVLGSSLTVTPANMFPQLAKEAGAKLVIVNHDPTPIDSQADFLIQNKSIKEVLVEVNNAIRNK